MIIERRPVGRVTVAVASVAAGVGCTHTALMAAALFLKIQQQGKNNLRRILSSYIPAYDRNAPVGKQLARLGATLFRGFKRRVCQCKSVYHYPALTNFWMKT